MSQDANTQPTRTSSTVLDHPPNQLIHAPAGEPESLSIEPVEDARALVESYAENLIDELFEDVNRMLDYGATVPQTANSYASSVTSLALSVPDANAPGESSDESSNAPSADSGNDSSRAASSIEADNKEHRRFTSPMGLTVDRVLLLAACASLGITIALWAVLHGRQSMVADAPQSNRGEVLSQADREFLDYMDRSLETIDRKAELEKRTAALANPSDSGSNIDLDSLTSLSQVSSTLPNSPERVYVPVQPTPEPFAPSPVSPQPTAPAQPPPQQQASAPTPAPAPTPPPAAESAPEESTSASAPNIAPSASHALVALLQMGDRSAAIFEFNNTARRVDVGGQIGTSGWTLVSVSDQEAVIRRNGDVRSIYIGQSF
jgi:hypothetical protein